MIEVTVRGRRIRRPASLMLMRWMFGSRSESGHLDLVVEVADVARIALSFIDRMWSR